MHAYSRGAWIMNKIMEIICCNFTLWSLLWAYVYLLSAQCVSFRYCISSSSLESSSSSPSCSSSMSSAAVRNILFAVMIRLVHLFPFLCSHFSANVVTRVVVFSVNQIETSPSKMKTSRSRKSKKRSKKGKGNVVRKIHELSGSDSGQQ